MVRTYLGRPGRVGDILDTRILLYGAKLTDPPPMESEDQQAELSKILKDARRSSLGTRKGASKHAHRIRRLKALSFGGGVMLIAYNGLQAPAPAEPNPDLLSLLAAVLILTIAGILFASGFAKERKAEQHRLHVVALVAVAFVLTAQALPTLYVFPGGALEPSAPSDAGESPPDDASVGLPDSVG